MRTWMYFFAALITVSILGSVIAPTQAQSGYEITWSFIGVAHSTNGGEYSLSSTIGKPGQTVSGGNYTMDGGLVFNDETNNKFLYVPLIMK